MFELGEERKGKKGERREISLLTVDASGYSKT